MNCTCTAVELPRRGQAETISEYLSYPQQPPVPNYLRVDDLDCPVHHPKKVKAREVIPGWPRGKSTSGPSLPPVWIPHSPTVWESVSESCSESIYHAAQQAMVDRWHQDGDIKSLSTVPLTAQERVEAWRRLILQANQDRILRSMMNFWAPFYDFTRICWDRIPPSLGIEDVDEAHQLPERQRSTEET